MCIRDRNHVLRVLVEQAIEQPTGEMRGETEPRVAVQRVQEWAVACLLYTSDAADERSSVDLGGRRIIKKKK